MAVDYLRSCYKSEFLINEETGQRLVGRFYRPPEGTKMYLEPTIFRSGIWIGERYLDEHPGDTLEEKEYDKGAFDVDVVNDLKRTRLAQVGCDKQLELVPGAMGFPLACDPFAEPENVRVKWDTVWWMEKPPNAGLVNPVLLFQDLARVAPFTWEADIDTFPALVRVRVSVAGGLVSLLATEISQPAAEFAAKVSWASIPGQVLFDNRSATPLNGWEYADAMQPWQPILIFI